MTETRRCSACGAELLEGAAPQGPCPACLLRLGLSNPSITTSKVESPSEPLSPAPPPPPPLPPAPPIHRKTKRILPIIGSIVLLMAVAAGATFFFPGQPPDDPVIRFTIQPPSNAGLRPAHHAADFALSPDGRRLAFVANGDSGQRLLWIRPFDSTVEQPLLGTEDATFPFWSPDSRWVAFFSQGKLKKIDIGGGGAQTLCLAPSGRGGTWSEDGTILFAPNGFGGLARVRSNGASPEVVFPLDNSQHETAYRWPHFLPGGRRFIYSVIGTDRDRGGIYVGSLDSHERIRLLSDPSPAAYCFEGGRVLFVRNGMLMVQPFDARRLTLSGEAQPVPFAEQIKSDTTVGAEFSVSVNGIGMEERVFTTPDIVSLDSWSPDGRFVSFTKRGERGKTEVWALPLSEERKPFPAVRSEFNLKHGRISPDGRWLAYVSDESGMDQIFVQTFPAPQGKWQISASGGVEPQWSRDGKELFYIAPEGMLVASPVRGGAAFEAGLPKELFRARSETYAVSPDGRFLIASPPPDAKSTPIQIVAGWGRELRP